jgi:hypothetical protein
MFQNNIQCNYTHRHIHKSTKLILDHDYILVHFSTLYFVVLCSVLENNELNGLLPNFSQFLNLTTLYVTFMTLLL